MEYNNIREGKLKYFTQQVYKLKRKYFYLNFYQITQTFQSLRSNYWNYIISVKNDPMKSFVNFNISFIIIAIIIRRRTATTTILINIIIIRF